MSESKDKSAAYWATYGAYFAARLFQFQREGRGYPSEAEFDCYHEDASIVAQEAFDAHKRAEEAAVASLRSEESDYE